MPSARVFPRFRTDSAYSSPAHWTGEPGTQTSAADPAETAAPQPQAGYDSPVCSNTGDAIDRIVAAIDQLASDAHVANAKAREDELTTRVATLWQMVSDIDPELARRAQRYTGPVDGDPSV